jgi:hypothetical protein
MATEILRGILSFAVGVVGWWIDNPCTELFGVFVVFVDVGYAHHYRVTDPACRPCRQRARVGGSRRRSAWVHAQSGNDDGTLAEGELGTVLPNPQPFYEPERAAKLLDRLAHVGVGKHWDNHAEWHGAVRQYSGLLVRVFHLR